MAFKFYGRWMINSVNIRTFWKHRLHSIVFAKKIFSLDVTQESQSPAGTYKCCRSAKLKKITGVAEPCRHWLTQFENTDLIVMTIYAKFWAILFADALAWFFEDLQSITKKTQPANKRLKLTVSYKLIVYYVKLPSYEIGQSFYHQSKPFETNREKFE